MINICYKSEIIENFLIKNITTIPLPVKIYQDYLIKALKNKMGNISEHVINLMVYGDLGYENMRKMNEIFDLIAYMPFKKY
jgi:hypothetical protein